MRACVGAEPRERRGWGRAACEVYGALERLTAKALRQMQHRTDIQVVSEPGGDFRSVRQRDDILADSRRPGGASRDNRLTDNTYYVVGSCRLFKEVETSVHQGENFEFRLENHKRLAIYRRTDSRPVPKDRRRP